MVFRSNKRVLRGGYWSRRAVRDMPRWSLSEVHTFHGNQVTVHAFEKLKPEPEQVFAVSRYQNW
jgi:hypothetical protein